MGNPANTNALIAQSNAPDVPAERFTAMTRLDHNRAISQLAEKSGAPVADITNMTIWGNHSATQYPDIFHAEVGGQNAAEAVDDQDWLENDFIPTVAQARRGDHRGPRRLVGGVGRQRRHRPRARLGPGTADGDWVSMAIPSDGSYGVPEGLISSFPVTSAGGDVRDRPGPGASTTSPAPASTRSVDELVEERDAVRDLGLVLGRLTDDHLTRTA